jgi:Cu(I)/Ag(I) efflux system membrane fusion protein
VTRRAPLMLLLLALGLACERPREGDEHVAHGAAAAPAPAPAAPHAGHELPPGMAEVEVPDDRRQLLGVRTEEVTRRTLSRSFRTVGIVVADERRVRRIQTKISGWVEELFVNFTGELVRPGQPILAVYSPELVATQQEYLLAFDSPPEQRALLLESARARLALFDVEASHVAELERTRTPQRRITLHAPIGGYVTVKSVLQGTYVTPEMELYTVADLDAVWIWADVTEEEIPFVSLGQRARIELTAAPGERDGKVSFLQPTLDTETRTLRIRFDVPNEDGALRPGMYATVSLERPLGEVVALPEEAVIDTGLRKVVFVEVAEGRFQPREVTLGRKGDTHYEVLSGLAPGERAVVSAQFLLDSESRLRGVAAPAHGTH